MSKSLEEAAKEYAENKYGKHPSMDRTKRLTITEYSDGWKAASLDYEEVLADHRQLVKEIDIVINKENAAKQASLCDLVGQIKQLASYQSERERELTEALEKVFKLTDSHITRGIIQAALSNHKK